jgi:hypothetical protein
VASTYADASAVLYNELMNRSTIDPLRNLQANQSRYGQYCSGLISLLLLHRTSQLRCPQLEFARLSWAKTLYQGNSRLLRSNSACANRTS